MARQQKKRYPVPEHEEFISSLGLSDEKEITRYRNALFDMHEILQRNGHDVPDEADYTELRMSNTYRMGIEKFVPTKSRIEQFYGNKTRKDINMNDTAENSVIDVEPIEPVEAEQAVEISSHGVNELIPQESTEQAEKKTRGRKPKYDISRNSKVTIYVTKELQEDIEALCTLKNISVTEYIVSILEKEIAQKKIVLEEFKELQARI